MLLPNASLFQTTTTYETITLPPSNLNQQTSSLLPPSPKILLLILQLLLTFLPHLYKRYTPHHQNHHHNPSQLQTNSSLTQQIATLTSALASLRHQNALLQETLSLSHTPYPSPQLLRSVSDKGEEYNEFGFPPPLEEGDELILPSPIVGKMGGHAALGCFYRREVVYERVRWGEGGEVVVGEDY